MKIRVKKCSNNTWKSQYRTDIDTDWRDTDSAFGAFLSESGAREAAIVQVKSKTIQQLKDMYDELMKEYDWKEETVEL